MTKPDYDTELEQLDGTYEAALAADVAEFKAAIAGASDSSVIGIGSGGSFTAASLLCNLHEFYTGQVSRPSTPLEIICNPTIAASSPIFLVSAEGKNPDIVEALRRARLYSARTVHILTNREGSPLLDHTKTWPDVTSHVYSLATKDGYLATNSLLFDAILVARAYGELDAGEQQLPLALSDLRIGTATVDAWLDDANDFVERCVERRSLLLLFSPLLKAVAADLESKLSEAALINCQLADLRSFAHGRHLWLSERPEECAIISLVDRDLGRLWDATRSLIPPSIPFLSMNLSGAAPADLVSGLVAQMKLVAKMASRVGRDLANPRVQQYGRDLHYLDLKQLIPSRLPSSQAPTLSTRSCRCLVPGGPS